MNVAELRARGFDLSSHVPFTKQYRVRCSCCEAVAINGVPTHESGCPNDVRECDECGALIQMRHRYCDDCSS